MAFFQSYNNPSVTNQSMPGLRGDGQRNEKFLYYGTQCNQPVRPTLPLSYTESFNNVFYDNILPRAARGYNIVPRIRKFPVEEWIPSKAANINTFKSETYYQLAKQPNPCMSDFCKKP